MGEEFVEMQYLGKMLQTAGQVLWPLVSVGQIDFQVLISPIN